MPTSQVQRPPPATGSPEIPVVAIGASAGGLEALTAILRALPADIAMAFMLIQHLDPKRHSILPELLSKATRIPVLEAIDAMKIESNRVYVMPSNVDISITDGHFGLIPRVADHKQHLPIDIFMRSLAKVRKGQAIGVILSGTASDGTAGIVAIRGEGGVTFAQSPETAKFDGMPRSAIESGCIDYVLSPEQIAAELSWMSSHPNTRRKSTDSLGDPKDDDYVFDSILNLVSTSQGADFTKYKPNTIHRRTLLDAAADARLLLRERGPSSRQIPQVADHRKWNIAATQQTMAEQLGYPLAVHHVGLTAWDRLDELSVGAGCESAANSLCTVLQPYSRTLGRCRHRNGSGAAGSVSRERRSGCEQRVGDRTGHKDGTPEHPANSSQSRIGFIRPGIVRHWDRCPAWRTPALNGCAAIAGDADSG
jgi:hypothetical protein